MKCQGLLCAQVHLHVFLFKTWQAPLIKRTFSPFECAGPPLPTLTEGDPCPDSASHTPNRTKPRCHRWHDVPVTHRLLCAPFQTPKETTNFYECVCVWQRLLLQNARSCERDSEVCDPRTDVKKVTGLSLRCRLYAQGLLLVPPSAASD